MQPEEWEVGHAAEKNESLLLGILCGLLADMTVIVIYTQNIISP